MRQIFKADASNVSVAWIGESAPVPAGWFLDVNTAKENDHGLRKEVYEGRQGREEEVTVFPAVAPMKKRGRPKKGYYHESD